MYVGESTVEIKTEADSNDITESSYPLHNKPSIGVCVGFYVAIMSLCHVFGVCIGFVLFFNAQT